MRLSNKTVVSLLLSLSLLTFSCQEDENIELPANEKTVTYKMKGGNGNPCTVYKFEYYTDPGPVFSAADITETCINTFRGVDRIIGTQFGSSVACLIDGSDTNPHGNISCDPFVELYYKPGKFKYRVVLSGGNWTGACPPMPGDTSCLSFSLMQIGADGRHDKDCLTRDQLIYIGDHKVFVVNHGEVL